MSQLTVLPLTDAAAGMSPADLEPLLRAFNEVTARLTQTHESLTAQVTQLKAELSEANQQVQRSRHLAMLGEMAAGIAHEVRNPLGSIMLYARQLQEDLGDRPQQQTTAAKIASAVSRLDVIVRDVLVFSRESRLAMHPVSAYEVFEAALDSARSTDPMWSNLTIHGPDATDQGVVFPADAGLLHQAFVNLIRNAVEAMSDQTSPRHLFLSAGVRRVVGADGSASEMALLSIRDTGPGVAPELAARIFTPFFTTRATGTGLGLAIVHRIIDAHAGRVTLSSTQPPLPTGAVVEVLLPLH